MPVTYETNFPGVESVLFPTLHSQEDCTSGTPYLDYRMDVGYNYSPGILQLPVADPKLDGSVECEIVRVCSPFGVKVVSWSASRDGAWPTIPDPFAVDPNSVLVDAVITPRKPTILAGGVGHCYVITGTYYYALKKPVKPGMDLPTAGTPEDVTPAVSNAFPGSNVRQMFG